MDTKYDLSKDLNKQGFRYDSLISDNNNKPYKAPVLVEYGDVASIIELGGNGAVDFSGGPDFGP